MAANRQTEQTGDDINLLLRHALLGAFALLAGALSIYFLAFGNEGCCDQARWGEFGDFLGGTINPFLGFLSLLVLARTLIEQRRLMSETRQRAILEEMQRVIASSCDALDKYLERPYHLRPSTPQGDSLHDIRDFCQMMGLDPNILRDAHRIAAGTPQHLRNNPGIARAAHRWIRLVRLFGAYIEQGGSQKVVQLYASAYHAEAVVFHALWPTSFSIDNFGWLGFSTMEPQARALASKYAEAELSAPE